MACGFDARCRPGYPLSSYSDNLACSFKVSAAGSVAAVGEFYLEDGCHSGNLFDFLGIDSTLFCGATGPSGVNVDADQIITFESDSSSNGMVIVIRWILPLECQIRTTPDQQHQGASLFPATVSSYSAIRSRGNLNFSLLQQDQLTKLS